MIPHVTIYELYFYLVEFSKSSSTDHSLHTEKNKSTWAHHRNHCDLLLSDSFPTQHHYSWSCVQHKRCSGWWHSLESEITLKQTLLFDCYIKNSPLHKVAVRNVLQRPIFTWTMPLKNVCLILTWGWAGHQKRCAIVPSAKPHLSHLENIDGKNQSATRVDRALVYQGQLFLPKLHWQSHVKFLGPSFLCKSRWSTKNSQQTMILSAQSLEGMPRAHTKGD